ncbi:MAG: cobalamin B12-binding domain-containing protein [Planctomycetota bacterium]
MNEEIIGERLFQALTAGDRTSARSIIRETRDADLPAEELSHRIFWPALEMINQLFRADQLTTLAHHYATRLLRSLVDQAQAGYEQKARRDHKVLMFCGDREIDDLAAQLAADLLEADGYEVYFSGGGVANDEILEEVGVHRPHTLLMFGSAPSDAPNIRQLIDHIRAVGACPEMQIVVGGGVFNRAEGLAEEIGADLWAREPRELIDRLDSQKKRRATPEQRTVGRNRRTTTSKTKAA